MKELYSDALNEQFDVKQKNGRTSVLKMEVQNAFVNIKFDKTLGSDITEIISALQECGIDKITTLLNIVYDTGHIKLD